MLWFKFQARVFGHRKTRKLPRSMVEAPARTAAMGLLFAAVAWSADEESDGWVPGEEIERYDPDGVLSKMLVAAGYFEEAERDGERGIVVHDYTDWNQSAAECAAGRERERDKKAGQRRARKRGEISTDPGPPGGGAPGDVPPDVPAGVPGNVPRDVPRGHPGGVPAGVPETVPSRVPSEVPTSDYVSPGQLSVDGGVVVGDAGRTGGGTQINNKGVSTPADQARLDVPRGHPGGVPALSRPCPPLEREREKEKKSKNTPSPTPAGGDEMAEKRRRRSAAAVSDHPTSKTSTTPGFEALFEAWWERYPRKVGKIDASKAYARALTRPGVDADVLDRGLSRFLGSPDARRETRYLPHPSTWLNQGRWLDEGGRAAVPKTFEGWG